MMRLTDTNRHALLVAADSALALFVFFPSLISYWRGIWDLLGVYIFPDREPLNHWTTAAIGSVSVFGYFILPWLKTTLQPLKKSKRRSTRIMFYISSRCYMYLYAAFYMAFWRGLWSLGDYYMLKYGWKGDLIMLVSLYAVLALMRSARTIIFPPYVVTIDTRHGLMKASTRLGMQPHEPAKYLMDCLLTHFVIIPIAILTWRSAWATVGHFLFPEDAWLSDVVALAIGFPATILLFAFQSPLAKVSCKLEERGDNFAKLLYEDFVYLITSLCQFFIWRGGWNLNARYLLADPLVGGWVNHVVGTILLMCLQLFSYVSACGCALDGFDPRGKAIFPLRYLRHYLRHYKKTDPGTHVVEKISAKVPMEADKDTEKMIPIREIHGDEKCKRASISKDEQNSPLGETSKDKKLTSNKSSDAIDEEEVESLMKEKQKETDPIA